MKPADPAIVEQLFGDRASLAYRYAELLTGPGVERGLLGPREAPRVWDRHLLNCAVIESCFPRGAAVCDVGSGAGLPGIVLALARPDLRITLLEPMQRRVSFLELVVDDLGIDCEVRRDRADALAGRDVFDAVTARAVAALERLVTWAMPLVRQGGELVAMKGESAESELQAASRVLARYGAVDPRIEVHGLGMVTPPTTVVRIRSSRTFPQQKGSR